MSRPSKTRSIAFICPIAAALVLGAYALAHDEGGETERRVKESEVPKAALDALKDLAGGAALTEFSEEIENGATYYEGSWKGTHGNVDALVTPSGDLVELEEVIPLDSLPKPVLEKARKAAGQDAKLFVEKKTYVMYEVKYRTGDRRHEVVYSPDGRTHGHEQEEGDDDQDD